MVNRTRTQNWARDNYPNPNSSCKKSDVPGGPSILNVKSDESDIRFSLKFRKGQHLFSRVTNSLTANQTLSVYLIWNNNPFEIFFLSNSEETTLERNRLRISRSDSVKESIWQANGKLFNFKKFTPFFNSKCKSNK